MVSSDFPSLFVRVEGSGGCVGVGKGVGNPKFIWVFHPIAGLRLSMLLYNILFSLSSSTKFYFKNLNILQIMQSPLFSLLRVWYCWDIVSILHRRQRLRLYFLRVYCTFWGFTVPYTFDRSYGFWGLWNFSWLYTCICLYAVYVCTYTVYGCKIYIYLYVHMSERICR